MTAEFVRHGEPPGCGKWNCVLCNALPQSADSGRVIDTWLDAFQEVDMVSAAVAHHHATGHPGGSDGESYWCDGCEFGIERGWVVAGGMIRTLPPNGRSATDE